MAAFEPPTATYPIFDSLAFQTPNVATQTIAEADQRYLARQNVATSVATSTNFAGDVTGVSFSGNFRTLNTNEAAPHYLNFSDSSSTGVGAIQKNAGLFYFPSTQVLTVNNGISIPAGPILGRNDTGANTFFGTNPYAHHPIGWTIKATKSIAIPTSNVTVDAIAFGTPITDFNTLSNGVWQIGVYCNNTAGLGNMTFAQMSYGAVTGGTVINGSTGISSTSVFHQTTSGLSNMGLSYPDLIVRTTGNGTTGFIVNFLATYSVQPTISFNIYAIKIG
jgi:hypothetical protein